MSYRSVRRGGLSVLALLFAVAGQAMAQTAFDACYVQKTGVVYRIDPTGTLPGSLPTACTKPDKHIQFSWVDGDGADHGSLNGLGDDDHAQYLPVDGSRAMTGNLGIGTTSAPTSPLTIKPGNGAEIEFASGTGNNADIHARNEMRIGTLNALPVHLVTDNQFRVSVAGNGNVGVGTATPGEKLSVNGVIHSTTGGVKFPDGTTQTTAATPAGPWAGYVFSQHSTVRDVPVGYSEVFNTQAACDVNQMAVDGGSWLFVQAPGDDVDGVEAVMGGSGPAIVSAKNQLTGLWKAVAFLTNNSANDVTVAFYVWAACVPGDPYP